MRIGQVSPLFERVPPRKYGGTELVVSHLTEELVRRGHDVTLFASGERARRATSLRTLAAGTPRYNPVSYHNGSIWPHDNAILAAGLARYGHKGEALHIASGLFAAARTFDLRRLPELLCGFRRRRGQGPTVYPMANAPQAWAAAAPFLVLASLLGLVIDAPEKRIALRHPVLPPFTDVVELLDLDAGGGQVSLRFERHEHDVAVRVISRDPGIEIAVLK